MENETKNLIVKDEISNEEIKNLIYTIRGKQVMLDSDVAMLYQCETRIINQAVKRNRDRFPERFCFKLTESEVEEGKRFYTYYTLNGSRESAGIYAVYANSETSATII